MSTVHCRMTERMPTPFMSLISWPQRAPSQEATGHDGWRNVPPMVAWHPLTVAAADAAAATPGTPASIAGPVAPATVRSAAMAKKRLLIPWWSARDLSPG